MLSLMYTAPADKSIDSITINEDFITKTAEPIIHRKKSEEESA